MSHECFKCIFYRRLIGLASVVDGLTMVFLPWHSWFSGRACIALSKHVYRTMRKQHPEKFI